MPVSRLLDYNFRPSFAAIRILDDNKRIKYILLQNDILDVDTDYNKARLREILPALPVKDWNIACAVRDSSTEEICFKRVSKVVMPGISNIWHRRTFDYLYDTRGGLDWGDLVRFRSCYCGRAPGITKYAKFPWQISRLRRETDAYEWIEGKGIGPRFLGHLAEEGRVIGFAMEYIDWHRFAGPEHLELCREALQRLHGLGVLHGDIDRRNFLIKKGRAFIIDFEMARRSENPGDFQAELARLEEVLAPTPNSDSEDE